MRKTWKIIRWIIIVALVVVVFVWAFQPEPIAVDLATVERGPMQVTVNQEGRTRVRELYVVSAPLTGELERITLDEGDSVEARSTVIARIQPVLPGLLDARTIEEAQARVRAAEAALVATRPGIVRAEAEVAHAKLQLDRTQRLLNERAVSQQEVESRQLALDVAEAGMRAAQASEEVARFQVEQAQAALLRVTNRSTTQSTEPFEVVSPISGKVLRIVQESAATVTAGTPLVEVADVTQLEAVIDVLSQDAVKIKPGAKVFFDRWGGEEPLVGTVRYIEPSGFTKISALGVEEQRVNVIADIANVTERAVGDQYRVDARVVVWEGNDVLKVHSGALFREGEQWAAYVAAGDKAELRIVTIGRMSGLDAQVLQGLNEGEKVILHPSDKIESGAPITPRSQVKGMQ